MNAQKKKFMVVFYILCIIIDIKLVKENPELTSGLIVVIFGGLLLVFYILSPIGDD